MSYMRQRCASHPGFEDALALQHKPLATVRLVRRSRTQDKVLKGPSSAGRHVSFHARLARSMMQVVAFIHHVCISLNAVLDVRDVGLSVRNRP